MNVREYIKENWSNSFRDSKDCEYSVTLPYKFTSPCADGLFFYLYYWDTYFINKGLLIDGYESQALNNILNIAYLIKKNGFMPNSSSIYMHNRTQVPLFASMCEDYYEYCKDKKFIEKVIDSIIIEYEFFMKNRVAPNGLNRYYSNADKEYHEEFAKYYKDRVKVVINDFSDELIGLNAIAECESGWDFSARFNQNCTSYNPIDLNSIMYKNELIIFKFLTILGKDNNYLDFAKRRKEKMNEIFLTINSYYDFNFIDGSYSSITTVASLLPFVVGLSDDKITFKQIINKLMFGNGIAATENIKCEFVYQWSYPNMWPNLVYFAFEAALKLNEISTAKEIGLKYLNTVDEEFKNTNCLWEKYDVNTKSKSILNEYTETKMLGWTAGVYVYIDNKLKELK